MNYKEQMTKWIANNPDATLEEAWEAGYMFSTDAWCHGKVSLMAECRELINQILS